MPKIAGKSLAQNYTPPKSNPEHFHELFDILHEVCFRGNWTATARALGISINTAKHWDKKPPSRHAELVNLLSVIKDVQKFMAGSKNKKQRDLAQRILHRLSAIGLTDVSEYMAYNTASESECMIHLLSTIAWTKQREMSTEELHKPANSGGFSKRSLRLAAERLGLQKDTTGFGGDKITWYSIPEP